MKTWFTIKAAAQGSDTAEISIYDEIGYWGVTAKDFISEFNAKTKDATKVSLSINSPGGSVFDGFAIVNALKASGKEIHVTVMGLAASMASVIAMVGKTRKMPANTMLMVHNALTGVYGDAADLQKVAGTLENIDNSIVGAYVGATGQTEAKIRDLMSADTWMTAAEALDLGFATEVIDEVKATASFEVDRFPEKIRALFKGAASAPQPAQLDVAEIKSMIKAAGLDAHVEVFLLDEKLQEKTALKAALDEAVQIVALCNALSEPGATADTFIKTRKTIAEARAGLLNARAERSAKTEVDKRPKKGDDPSGGPAPAAKKQLSVVGYWADQAKQRSNKQ